MTKKAISEKISRQMLHRLSNFLGMIQAIPSPKAEQQIPGSGFSYNE